MKAKQEMDGLDEREPRHEYEPEKVRQRDVDEEREEHPEKVIDPPASPDYLKDGLEKKPEWEKNISVETGIGDRDGKSEEEEKKDAVQVPEEIPTLMEEMVDRVKDYVNIKAEILLLKAVDKVSMSGAATIAYVIFAFLFVLVMFLLSTGLALWVNEKLDSGYAGFLVVGGAYAVLCIVLFLGKEKLLKKPFAGIIIKAMLND